MLPDGGLYYTHNVLNSGEVFPDTHLVNLNIHPLSVFSNPLSSYIVSLLFRSNNKADSLDSNLVCSYTYHCKKILITKEIADVRI